VSLLFSRCGIASLILRWLWSAVPDLRCIPLQVGNVDDEISLALLGIGGSKEQKLEAEYQGPSSDLVRCWTSRPVPSNGDLLPPHRLK
jgi:hypothetical protein